MRRVNFAFFKDQADDCVGCESWGRKLGAEVRCGSELFHSFLSEFKVSSVMVFD